MLAPRLSAGLAPAVAVLVGEGEDIAVCTGILVSTTRVLTGKHCLEAALQTGRTLRVVFEKESRCTAITVSMQGFEMHERLDAALLSFERASDAGSGMPMPLASELDSHWIDSPAELAGFGLTELNTVGQLHFAIEPVVAVEEDHIVVDGRGVTGACVGDSGGPLFGRANDGSVRIIGVLDDGDASCVGRDYYTRTDRLLEWPALQVAMADSDVDQSCAGLDLEGLCVRGRAMWCENGVQRKVQICSDEDLICGWNPTDDGFRCVREEDDACDGLGSRRHCEGDVLVSCEQGQPTRQECSVHCREWVDERGAACVQ